MSVNPKNPARLAALFHHRWAAPILSELHRGHGAKYVTLQQRLGISRDSLRRTLDDLIGRGLVMRNPGYGHPMRPEYVLAAAGREVGAVSGAVLERLERAEVLDLCLRKWSLAVLLAVGGGADRFSEIQKKLPEATPRALTTTLRQLSEAGLVERAVVDDYPPRTHYQLGRRARRWVPDLERLGAAGARGEGQGT